MRATTGELGRAWAAGWNNCSRLSSSTRCSAIRVDVCLRLPLIQKRNDVVRIHGPRLLEFSIFLRVQQLAVRTKNRKCGHTAFQRHRVLLSEVVVLLAV